MRAVVLRVSDMPLDSVVRISRDSDALFVEIDAESITEPDAHVLERKLNGDCLLHGSPDQRCRPSD
jgi:hypothetical protein